MKKEQRKKMMNIIVIIVTIGMLASIVAGITLIGGNNKTEGNSAVSVENSEAVLAEIKEAEFGSIVKVSLTDKGKGQYADAATYELFDAKGQMSKRVPFGTEATIFPAMAPENKVDIKIYTKDNKEIASIKATFVKWK
jgi:hypothetical protein